MFDRIMGAGLAEQIAVVKGIPDWRTALEREPFRFLRI
jgi:hypothetical protein